jgi:hypothetical protein
MATAIAIGTRRIPDDVWFVVAEHIPHEEKQELYAVNRPLSTRTVSIGLCFVNAKNAFRVLLQLCVSCGRALIYDNNSTSPFRGDDRNPFVAEFVRSSTSGDVRIKLHPYRIKRVRELQDHVSHPINVDW